MLYQVALACGCRGVRDLTDYPEHLRCEGHSHYGGHPVEQKIIGIETREWKVSCCCCRYARWYGADRSGARVARRKHEASSGHSPIEITYMTPEAVRKRFRDVYGRSMKLFIEEQIVVRAKINHVPVVDTRKEENEDVIPF